MDVRSGLLPRVSLAIRSNSLGRNEDWPNERKFELMCSQIWALYLFTVACTCLSSLVFLVEPERQFLVFGIPAVQVSVKLASADS